MSKRILITGAGSGFGKGAALGLAKNGHQVIACVQIEPQKSDLLQEAKSQGVALEVLVLDITNASDRQFIFQKEIDVLINNAGVMETGPVADIPMDNVRRNFEVNVFGTIEMARGFLPQMVNRGSGKIVFTSSMGGLITVPFGAIYTATKHALEGLVEGIKDELMGTGVEICTINPGAYGTGFNDRGAETMMKWFNPTTSLSKMETIQAVFESGGLDNQLDPQELIEAMIRIAEEDNSLFRNVVPAAIIPWIKATQERTWTVRKNDTVSLDPKSL